VFTPQALASDWQLTDLRLLARTPRSDVFAARQRSGQRAAVKVFTPAGQRSEGAQVHAFRAWDGDGAVRCIAARPEAIALEWAGRVTLGDLSRAGQDRLANTLLATIAKRLRLNARPEGARDLTEYTRALTALDPAGFPSDRAHLIEAAQSLLKALLATAPAPAFLHGDLHHDNIARARRGWLAYDPKSVWGDPHFEFANAFRNPHGLPVRAFTANRARIMAQIFAQVSGLDPERLQNWAAVKAALSIAWCANTGPAPESDWHILHNLMMLSEYPLP